MSVPRKESIRVVVAGDANVGKTSLIAALMTGSFQSNTTNSEAPVVEIPADVSPERVSTLIVDTPTRADERERVDRELMRADAICLVFDVSRPETLERVQTHWLPRIRALNEIRRDWDAEARAESRDGPDSSDRVERLLALLTGGAASIVSASRNAGGAERGTVADTDEVAAGGAEFTQHTPIILVGNKVDLRQRTLGDAELEQMFAPITAEFKEVECCAECSAKSNTNVREVFYFANKAVLYPTAVLVNVSGAAPRLRSACARALTRIFRLCDTDNDGLLNDDELNQFQQRVFQASLTPEEIRGVKHEVAKCDGGIERDGITDAGFIFLHQLFIQKGRLETVWSVLRKFGYADSLQLHPRFLVPSVDASFLTLVPAALSADGERFFRSLFRRFCPTKVASRDEIDNLFATADGGQPWGLPFAQRLLLAGITEADFVAYWAATTLYEWRVTLAYAAMLGYDGDTLRLVRFRKDVKERRTFRCFLIGSRRSGKTSVLHALCTQRPLADAYDDDDDDDYDDEHADAASAEVARNDADDVYDDATASADATETRNASVAASVLSGIVSVSGAGGAGAHADVVLSVHEVHANALGNETLMNTCDLACFLFDGSDEHSFGATYRLYERAKTVLPPHAAVALLATKSDLPAVRQQHAVSPSSICEPLAFSVRSDSTEKLARFMADRILSERRRARLDGSAWPAEALGVLAGGAMFGLVLGGFYYYKHKYAEKK